MLARTASPAPRFGSRRPALKSVHRTDLTGYAGRAGPLHSLQALSAKSAERFCSAVLQLGERPLLEPKADMGRPGKLARTAYETGIGL